MRKRLSEGLICFGLLVLVAFVAWRLHGALSTGDVALIGLHHGRSSSPVAYWLVVATMSWGWMIFAVLAAIFTWAFIQGPHKHEVIDRWLRSGTRLSPLSSDQRDS